MRRLLHILLACLFMNVSVNAQRMYRFSIGRMSDNRFHAICEDLSGFIWIGTENGLNRYDGYNFYKFYHNDNDSLSLMSNYVRSLYTDDNGTLWIGTNRGVQYLKPSEKSFITVNFPTGKTAYIQKICQLSDGKIWIVAQGVGIYWIDPDNPDKLNSAVAVNTYSNQAMFRTMLEDEEGVIWLGTPSGVLLYDPKTDKVTEFRRDVINRDITSINMDNDGNMFITTNNHLFMWNQSAHSLQRLTPPEGIWEITHSFIDNEGLKISLRGKGLMALNKKLELENVEFTPMDRSLDKMDISAYYKDNAGNRWIGCFLSDLILVTKDRNEFEYWKFNNYQRDVNGTVTALETDTEGRLWIGYNNNGLTCMSSDGKVLRDGKEAPYVSCLFRDSHDRIWVGYPSGGLARLYPQTGQLKTIITNEYSNVSSIAEDRQGRIYYSELGSGFSRFNPSDVKVEQYASFTNSENGIGLSNDWIHYMVVDSLNRLWIGHDNGADCYDIDQNRFIRNPKLSAAMGTSSCTSILEERKGIMWFGTTQGVIVYNTVTGKSTKINTSNGLSNNDVRSMVKDDEGLIWACTPGGVNSIVPITFEVSRFYSEEKEFNRVSAYSERDGKVFFGSNRGITSFYPHNITTGSTVNNVVMTGFYLNGEPITIQTLSGGNTISNAPLSMSNRFRLAYRDNSFTLEFSTLNYGDETSLIYEYSLNLEKSEWTSNPPGVNRFSFSNLRSGKYNLSVRARLNDIVSDAKTYTIKIEAPWYASVPAIVIYVLLLLSILMLVYWARRKTRNREMDEAKFQSFINVAHEICAPMTMVISPLEDMLHDDNIPLPIQSNLRQMHKSSTRILSLINQLIDMRKYDEGQMHLRFAETDLINFLMGPFELYTQTAERHNIDFRFVHSMSEQTVWIDRDSMDKVMMNLLSNAFKYTPNDGSIEISVEVGTDDKELGPLHNYVQVSVQDTGIGLGKEDPSKVFQRFYRAFNNATSQATGMGIGLSYSQMLVSMHQGVIKAANRSDGHTGSVFSFRLPLGCSHIDPNNIIDSTQIARPQLERTRASMYDYDKEPEKRPTTTIKVLIVDDDDTMMDYLKDNLKHNYKIITARNGKEGLKLAVSQMPDLIITDVVMPVMDGIELVRSLKGNSLVSHIPVILLSGKNKLQDRMLGLDNGADSYLAKPFYMSELKSLMSNLINNRLLVKGKFSGKQEQTQEVTPVEFESTKDVFMKRIMNVINKNISNSEFTVNQMVDEVGMSRSQLHRYCKEVTGYSASRFLQNIRMQQAMKLLKEKKENVIQIAYTVGFASQAHFSTLFKQYYGVTPTEYIKQLEEEENKNKNKVAR